MNADEVRELLPWYAAGALSAAERRAVEAQLRESAELRNELEEYRRLKVAVTEESAEDPEFRPELIQQTWRSIDEYEQKKSARSAATSEGPVTRLRRFFAGWEALPMGGRLAIAAQFAVILVLGGVLIGTVTREPTFGTASGSNTVAGAYGQQFSVVFQPEATETAIRELLESAQLEIIAGPSAEQKYVLAAPKDSKVDNAAMLARLRAATAVVRFAQVEE